MVFKLPEVGGFQPFPNSIMVPFMGYQSAVLAYNFGVDYELGKRTVKSMDNDQFNLIRAGDTSHTWNVTFKGQEYQMTPAEYIPFLKRQHMLENLTAFREALPDAKSLMTDIITFGVDIEKLKIPANIEVMKYWVDTIFGQLNDSLATVLEALLGLESGSLPRSDDPPTEPPPPPPTNTLAITFNYLDDCTGQSRQVQTGELTAEQHASSCDSAYYTQYKQGILSGDSLCQNNTRYNAFLTYVQNIEAGFIGYSYPYDTTKRH